MGMEFSDRLKRLLMSTIIAVVMRLSLTKSLTMWQSSLRSSLKNLKRKKIPSRAWELTMKKKHSMTSSRRLLKKYEFEYPDDKMIELSKRIKVIVDDKAKYTDWSTRDDIKANLQVDLILLLDEFDYPPVTIDDVYKEVLEQAENFKKYSE